MKKINQQFYDGLMMGHNPVTPKVEWGDVCLSIAQDLAQAAIIVEGEYYESFINN